MSAVQDLRERLIERINQSQGELERLREALVAYDGAAGAPARPAPGPLRSSRRAVEPTPAAVLAAIPADGISRARLREEIGGTEASVLGMLKQLEADGQVTRRGERRATTWHRSAGSDTAPRARRRARRAPNAGGSRRGPARPDEPASDASNHPASGDPGTPPSDASSPAAPERASAVARPAERPAAPATQARRGRGSATGKPRRASKRAAQELSAQQIERLLAESNDGLSLVALARRAGVAQPVVRERLLELERSGRVRSSGSRRTSRWRWISDEQRIAERAAELAQASNTSR